MMDDPPGNTEAALIARAQQGDPAALTQIYEQHHGQIYRYVLYRVGDVPVAEDLTSEVFVRLVERIGRFRYDGRPILAWLYTIARHLVVDHFRGRPQSRALLDDEAEEAALTAETEGEAAQVLERQALIEALSHLTEDQRAVIWLKFVEGYDNETVATILAKPVGAVKSLQHRALAALSRRLRPRKGDVDR